MRCLDGNMAVAWPVQLPFEEVSVGFPSEMMDYPGGSGRPSWPAWTVEPLMNRWCWGCSPWNKIGFWWFLAQSHMATEWLHILWHSLVTCDSHRRATIWVCFLLESQVENGESCFSIKIIPDFWQVSHPRVRITLKQTGGPVQQQWLVNPESGICVYRPLGGYKNRRKSKYLVVLLHECWFYVWLLRLLLLFLPPTFLLFCFFAFLLHCFFAFCPSLLLRFFFSGRFPVFVWHQNRPPHFIFEKKVQDSKLSES